MKKMVVGVELSLTLLEVVPVVWMKELGVIRDIFFFSPPFSFLFRCIVYRLLNFMERISKRIVGVF